MEQFVQAFWDFMTPFALLFAFAALMGALALVDRIDR